MVLTNLAAVCLLLSCLVLFRSHAGVEGRQSATWTLDGHTRVNPPHP